MIGAGTELERLIVRLVGDGKGYFDVLKEAQQKTMAWSTQVTSILKTAGKAGFAGLATAVGVATHAFATVGQEIDNVAKASSRLGITTQAFQELRHAGELSNVSMGELEQRLQFMTRTIGSAAAGGKKGAESLAFLGLEAGKLANLPVDEQLMQLADALQGVQNQSDKLRIAFDLFGRGGAQMLNIVQGGSKDLQAMREDARRLGLTFTNEQAKGVEDANDAMTRMNSSVKALKQSLVIGLAPAVEGVANAMANVVADNKQVIQDWASWATITSGVIAAIGALVLILGKLKKAFLAIKAAMIAVNLVMMANPWTLAAVAIGLMVAKLLDWFGVLGPILTKVKSMISALLGFNKEAEKTAAVVDEQAKATANAESQFAAYAKLKEQQEEAEKKRLKELEQIEAKRKQLRENVDQFIGGLELDVKGFGMESRMKEVLRLQQELGKEGMKLSKEQEKRIGGLNRELDRLEAIKKTEEEREEVYKSLAAKAHDIMMETLTPIEKLRTEIDDIMQLIEVGALTQQMGGKAINNLVSQAANKGGLAAQGAGAAVRAGSAEAFNLTNFGKAQRTTEKGVWELVKKADIQVRTEKEILTAIKNLNSSPATQLAIARIP